MYYLAMKKKLLKKYFVTRVLVDWLPVLLPAYMAMGTNHN